MMGDFIADGRPTKKVHKMGFSHQPSPARTAVSACIAPATVVSAAMASAEGSAPMARCCASTKLASVSGSTSKGNSGPTNSAYGSANDGSAGGGPSTGPTSEPEMSAEVRIGG